MMAVVGVGWLVGWPWLASWPIGWQPGLAGIL